MARLLALLIISAIFALSASASQLRGEQQADVVAASPVPNFVTPAQMFYDIVATRVDTTAAAQTESSVDAASVASVATSSPFVLEASGDPIIVEIKAFEGNCDNSKLETTSYHVLGACTPFGEYAGVKNITGWMKIENGGAVTIYPMSDYTCSGTGSNSNPVSTYYVSPGQCFSMGGHGFVAKVYNNPREIKFNGLYAAVYNDENSCKTDGASKVMMDEMITDFPRSLWGIPSTMDCKKKDEIKTTAYSIDKKMKAKIVSQSNAKLGGCYGPFAGRYMRAICY